MVVYVQSTVWFLMLALLSFCKKDELPSRAPVQTAMSKEEWAIKAKGAKRSQCSVAEFSEQSFQSHIRPIVVTHCLACHGERNPRGQFRADTFQPEQRFDSPEDKWRVAYGTIEAKVMPPGDKKLDDCEQEAFKTWLEQAPKPSSPSSCGSLPPEGLSFSEHILPITQKYCTSCHGGQQASANFRADTYDLTQDLTIQKQLWQLAVKAVAEKRMPPTGVSLEPCEEALLRQWVEGLGEAAGETKPETSSECEKGNGEELSFNAHILPLTNKYCLGCHNANSKRTRFDLFDDPNELKKPLEKFSQALSLIKAGRMPPSGFKPNTCEITIFSKWLEGLEKKEDKASSCQEALPAEPLSLRLLTKFEYINSLKSLFGEKVLNYAAPALATIPTEAREHMFDSMSKQLAFEHVNSYFKVASNVVKYFQLSPERWQELDACIQIEGGVSLSRECFEKIVRNYGLKIQRRPPTEETISTLINELFSSATDPTEALGQAFLYLLQSPKFLYVHELASLPSQTEGDFFVDDYELAVRLAFAIWKHPPDDELFSLAAAHKLSEQGVLSQQIDRMFADPKAKNAIDHFFTQWLHLNRFSELSQNAAFLKGINPEHLLEAARTSFQHFVRYIIFEQQGTFKDLFTSRVAFVADPEVAKIYGLANLSYSEPQILPANRSGLLTRIHTVIQAGMSSSPIQRGAMIRQNILCDTLGLPDPNEVKRGPEPEPGGELLTTREQWEIRTGSDSCQQCHAKINPLGFALEDLDSIGRVRDLEMLFSEQGELLAQLPVNTIVKPNLARFDEDEIAGSVALSQAISESDKAKQCFIRNWFRFIFHKLESRQHRCLLQQDRLGETKFNQPILKILKDFYLIEHFRKASLPKSLGE